MKSGIGMELNLEGTCSTQGPEATANVFGHA